MAPLQIISLAAAFHFDCAGCSLLCPVLWAQQGVLKSRNVKTVGDGDDVSPTGVIHTVKDEGADATNLETGGSDARDGGGGGT